MSEPRRPKNRVRPLDQGHWYSTTTTPPPVEVELLDRRGRARDRLERRRSSPGRPTLQLRWVHVIIGLALVGILGMVTLTLLAASHNSSAALPTATIAPVISAAKATTGPTPTLNVQPWDGKGRFTILIMGMDQRPGESLVAAHTDTMILLSLDPTTRTAGMLSIPRDLFVPFPGDANLQRINSAYTIGELNRPGGGPLLAMQTVQYNLSLKVNSYVIVNFATVVSLVDAVGGIDIDVPAPIDDAEYPDMNYGYDPLHIPAGHIHMDGVLALKYARTRHQTSDFDRTHRQQQVILALRDKVLKLNMIPELVRQAPQLWTQIQDGVLTNLTLDQMLSLGVYAKDIPFASIQKGTIENEYALAMQWNGDVVVTLNREKITGLMTQIFGANYAK